MKIEYQPYQCKRVLDRADRITKYKCGYIISPYIGCELGCVYCPWRFKSFMHRKGPSDSSRIIKIKINAPSILKKDLKHAKKGLICMFGYQPAEKEHRIIRKILEVLKTRKFPLHILTKSDMVLDDLDLLSRMAENWCAVTFCINTLDEGIAEIFEPNASSPTKRLEALGKIAEKGITTGIALAPIIPYITDSDGQFEEVIRKAADMNARYVLANPLVLGDECRSAVIKVLKRHFPELLPKYKALYEFGSAPDFLYTKKLRLRTRSLLKKYDLEEVLPSFPANDGKKQASIHDFMASG